MYNLRYHIASLVGVFLALALGLVLGGLVVQRGTVSGQQAALVQGLQGEFKTLRSDNEKLATENDALSSFSDEMADAWITDRLVGKNVVILTGSGRNDGLSEATDAVESAGGTAIVITMRKPALSLEDDTVRSRIASGSTFSADLLASVASSLAVEWTQPERDRPLTQALVEADALTIEGYEPGMVAWGIVNIAHHEGAADMAGVALAQDFDRLEAHAVIGEMTATDTGLISAASQKGLSALNTLGTAIGRYTLVALLTGADPGVYGVGENAIAVFPPLPAE